MPISPANLQILNDITALIGSTITSNVSSASAENDAFEAYIFALVVEAARREGAAIAYEDVNGNTGVTNLVFRTGPSYIDTRTQDYSHAVITFANKPQLEIHVGIYIMGRAGVRHECDVVVLEKTEADLARASGALPRSLHTKFAVECKFYSAAPGIQLGRSFLGFSKDTQRDCFFVMNISSPSVQQLLSQHLKHSCHERVHPNNQQDVELLTQSFCSLFRNYKHKR